MSNEPLNTGKVRFFLSFQGLRGLDRVEIAEPIGWDGIVLSLIQDSDRYGRDVFFSETEFSFNNDVQINGLTHEFDSLINTYKTNGFESEVLFILEVNDIDYIIGELDFVTAKTDSYRYFTCKIIQETAQVLIKRREAVSVDLFSDRNLDDRLITPITPSKMLLQALPETQTSEWNDTGSQSGQMTFNVGYVMSFIPVITQSGIEDTLSPRFEFFSDATFVKEQFKYIEADNTLTDLTLNISNLTYDFKGGVNNNPVKLWVANGLTFDDAELRFYDLPSIADNYEREIILPNLSRDEILWLWIGVENGTQTTNFTFNSGTFKITSTSLSISSTANVVRFIDAFRQVARSIGDYDVIAPRFDKGGEYFDQWITSGKLLRQITDDGFEISLKQLLGQLPEINGDYQILDSKTIYLGIYRDFFRDTEMSSFEMPPNGEFSETFSELYAVNKLNLAFKNYEKENDEDKSRQSVHTEIDVLLPNKSVENTKKVNIEFARDGFLIEKIRKDAIKVTEETATRDDSDIIILESVNKTLSFTESMATQQVKSGALNTVLNLINDNSFNWELLGMTELDVVTITGSNAGSWIVFEISPNILRLTPTNPTTIIEAREVIQFSYTVTATNLTQRIGDGFLDVGDIFLTNGAWSNKRIIRNYWAEFIRSCSIFRAGEKFLTTRYIHNRTWKSAEPNQPIVTEGDNFTQTTLREAIVTPFQVETQVICDFSTFWNLLEDCKNVRGYIIIKTTEGAFIKVYPSSLSFDWAKNLLNITGLKKI